MARTVTTSVDLVDDLDGSKAEQTISFAVEGTTYEIELSKKNAAAFTKMLKPYVDAARRVPATRTRSTSKTAPSAPARRTDLADIRAWAGGAGYEVSGRGRIPTAVVEAYDAR